MVSGRIGMRRKRERARKKRTRCKVGIIVSGKMCWFDCSKLIDNRNEQQSSMERQRQPLAHSESKRDEKMCKLYIDSGEIRLLFEPMKLFPVGIKNVINTIRSELLVAEHGIQYSFDIWISNYSVKCSTNDGHFAFIYTQLSVSWGFH